MAIFDSRTFQSTSESSARADCDGDMLCKGNKIHLAFDTLGQLLDLHVTASDQRDRAQAAELAKREQEDTGETVEVAFEDQEYTGKNAADAVDKHSIKLEVVLLSRAKRGVALFSHR